MGCNRLEAHPGVRVRRVHAQVGPDSTGCYDDGRSFIVRHDTVPPGNYSGMRIEGCVGSSVVFRTDKFSHKPDSDEPVNVPESIILSAKRGVDIRRKELNCPHTPISSVPSKDAGSKLIVGHVRIKRLRVHNRGY